MARSKNNKKEKIQYSNKHDHPVTYLTDVVTNAIAQKSTGPNAGKEEEPVTSAIVQGTIWCLSLGTMSRGILSPPAAVPIVELFGKKDHTPEWEDVKATIPLPSGQQPTQPVVPYKFNNFGGAFQGGPSGHTPCTFFGNQYPPAPPASAPAPVVRPPLIVFPPAPQPDPPAPQPDPPAPHPVPPQQRNAPPAPPPPVRRRRFNIGRGRGRGGNHPNVHVVAHPPAFHNAGVVTTGEKNRMLIDALHHFMSRVDDRHPPAPIYPTVNEEMRQAILLDINTFLRAYPAPNQPIPDIATFTGDMQRRITGLNLGPEFGGFFPEFVDVDATPQQIQRYAVCYLLLLSGRGANIHAYINAYNNLSADDLQAENRALTQQVPASSKRTLFLDEVRRRQQQEQLAGNELSVDARNSIHDVARRRIRGGDQAQYDLESERANATARSITIGDPGSREEQAVIDFVEHKFLRGHSIDNVSTGKMELLVEDAMLAYSSPNKETWHNFPPRHNPFCADGNRPVGSGRLETGSIMGLRAGGNFNRVSGVVAGQLSQLLADGPSPVGGRGAAPGGRGGRGGLGNL